MASRPAAYPQAPTTYDLVRRVGELPAQAALGAEGEIKQLQAGIESLYEGLRTVGMLSARYEAALRDIAIAAAAKGDHAIAARARAALD